MLPKRIICVDEIIAKEGGFSCEMNTFLASSFSFIVVTNTTHKYQQLRNELSSILFLAFHSHKIWI